MSVTCTRVWAKRHSSSPSCVCPTRAFVSHLSSLVLTPARRLLPLSACPSPRRTPSRPPPRLRTIGVRVRIRRDGLSVEILRKSTHGIPIRTYLYVPVHTRVSTRHVNSSARRRIGYRVAVATKRKRSNAVTTRTRYPRVRSVRTAPTGHGVSRLSVHGWTKNGNRRFVSTGFHDVFRTSGVCRRGLRGKFHFNNDRQTTKRRNV